jgi:hypothetical protein
VQCGPPRCAAGTRAEINEQVQAAMRGFSTPVEHLQTATGTKDKIAQHWIEILLKKAREMKANSPGRSPDEIAAELAEWYENQPGDKMNPLLLLESNQSKYFLAVYSLTNGCD